MSYESLHEGALASLLFAASIGVVSLKQGIAPFAKITTEVYEPGLRPFKGSTLDYKDEVVSHYLGNHLDDLDWREDPNLVDKQDVNTPDEWLKRHPELIRLTGRHPFNCEPPLQKLHKKGFITPAPLHYVRTHGATPNIKWEKHRLYIGGHNGEKVVLTMSQLLKLPRVSLPVLLVCCGNRRKEQNQIKQSIGFNWGAAGLSNGVWTGVRLVDVLQIVGIPKDYNGYHVRFASEHELGGDKLPGGVYGTSVPLVKVPLISPIISGRNSEIMISSKI